MSDDLLPVMKALEDAAPAVQAGLEATGVLGVLRQITGTVEDRFWIRRQRLFAERATEAMEELVRLGVPPVAIPDHTMRALFEYASVESNDDLGRVWTRLIASASEGKEIPRAYPQILSELEPTEAVFLDGVATAKKAFLPQPGLALVQLASVGVSLPGLEWRNLDNLERLGLVQYQFHGAVNVERAARPGDVPHEVAVEVTALGESFIAVCSATP